MVMPNPPRRQYWGYTRAVLVASGFTVVQDGDGEGVVTFNPANLKQVKLAVRAVGVKRRRVLSPADRERRAQHARSLSRRALSGAGRAQP
jgi:hypothetical protein